MGWRQPAATARIHGGAAPTHRDGTDPRRGGPNPPRRRGSTAGRRLPPTQSTAAQIRWAWRPPRPFLSLRRCGGLELRRIQSTAAAGSRFSAARIQARVGFFSFFLFFLNDLPRRAFLCGRRGKSNNRGGQSCPPREATIYRGLSATADRFARRGKPKTPDTDKYSIVVNRRPKIAFTSCNVKVISPQGRWNVWVSGLHLL